MSNLLLAATGLLLALSCANSSVPAPAPTSPLSPTAQEGAAPPIATVLSEDPPAAAASDAPPAGTEHTCPMHPDVRQKAPGKCPHCGMDLVPSKKASGSDDSAQDPHSGHAH